VIEANINFSEVQLKGLRNKNRFKLKLVQEIMSYYHLVKNNHKDMELFISK